VLQETWFIVQPNQASKHIPAIDWLFRRSNQHPGTSEKATDLVTAVRLQQMQNLGGALVVLAIIRSFRLISHVSAVVRDS
jgi:hypothetical protein